MTSEILILLFAMSVGAAFVQRVSGFGFGIFIMTVLPYLLPSYGEATTLSGLLALVTSTLITCKMWHHIQWRRLLPILLTFLVVSFFAIQWVALAGDGTLKRILGAVLIFAALWFLFLSRHISVRPTLPIQLSMGCISGVMGGLFGMQGPPAVLYFLACTETKEAYMAMAQCYFAVGNIVMTLYRSGHGFLTPAVGYGWLCGIAGVLLGTWLGDKVFNYIPIQTLRIIIYVYMALAGMIALFC